MDPFEEFEMKPLSEGLGFHKKAVPLSEQVRKSGLSESQTIGLPTFGPDERPLAAAADQPKSFQDLLRALEKPATGTAKATPQAPKIQITETLPEPGTQQRRQAQHLPLPSTPSGIPRPELPSLTPTKPAATALSKVVEGVGLKRGAADSPMRMIEKVPVAIPSAILDGVVVLALSLVFLVALMTVTKVDLAALIFQTGLDVPTKVAFGLLFISVMLMYVVVVRSLFGRTLGEWTFDFQMGDDQQHRLASYPMKVLWRSLLNVATGVILMPALSLILRRDVLAPLTGLQLYRQK